MIVDPEFRSDFLRELNKLVNSQTDQVLRGSYPDLASFERQRGVLVGLGMAIDLLEDKPATLTDTQSGEETNDSTED